MPVAKDIVNERKINNILKKTKNPSKNEILKILDKALEKKGLELEEIGYLLHVEDPDLLKKMFESAHQIKKEIYGERLVFFAPFYASSYCVNDCEYCGFHCRNSAPRKKLTLEEVEEQVKILVDMGHKRLLVEFGEHPVENPIEYVVDVIKTIYNTKTDCGEIRRANVNIAATTVENYKKLKEVGIGTYQLFQETYHQDTYKKLHKGPKADFKRQLFAHDRAFEAGIDDVGLGVLFGLYDYKFEVLSLVSHAQYLDCKFNVGPHTFSVPRFQPAETVDMDLPYRVSEDELLKIIAILRLSVPYTGMIISTRERPEIRAKAFKIGISQTSAASKASPGGYGKDDSLEQFSLADHRSLDEVIENILEQNLLPSFCTACYRRGRTGEKFMNLAKPGEIHHLCRPNAILTFKEYLEDYASPQVKKLGAKIIDKYMKKISDKDRRRETSLRLTKIEKGERDLYF
jgi:2-iminoacetate synthase